MDRNLFKKAIKWIGILIIAHIVSMIFFGLVFSKSLAHLSNDFPEQAKLLVFAYNIVFDAIFVSLLSKNEVSYTEYRKLIRESLKANSFSILNHFKTVLLKEHVIKLGIFMVFQIPFVIFFAIWGIELKYPTMFEMFYYMNAGAYILTNSALLGWICNTLLFGVVFTLVKILFVFLTKRDVENDICI